MHMLHHPYCRAGARHHGVAQEYRDWLDSIPAYDTTSMYSRLGAAALAPAVGLGLGMATAQFVSESVWGTSANKVAAAGDESGSSSFITGGGADATPASSTARAPAAPNLPGVMYDAMSTTANVVWTTHDLLLAPLFGKGV